MAAKSKLLQKKCTGLALPMKRPRNFFKIGSMRGKDSPAAGRKRDRKCNE